MEKAQDKKKKLPAAAKDAVKAGPAKPEVAQEKEDLGKMLRPDKEKGGKGLEVGAPGDKAEKEADKVAEAVAKPEAKTDEKAKDDTGDAEAGSLLPWIRGPPIRAGPEDTGILRRVPDQNGNQPNTDELSAVPAMEQNLNDVGVSDNEEALFDDMSGNDFDVLSEGQSSVMMKAMPGADHPGVLPASIARLITSPGPGAHLPASVAQRIGGRLGRDVSDIRVHSDRTAQDLATHIQARAFAWRNHVFLKSPSDAGNLKLMAHEVAHCIQQGATKPVQARAPPEPNPARAPPAEGGTLRRFDENGDDGWLARGAERLADNLDSYQLLKVLIGRRLFTGQTVQQTPMNYVGAFMRFIGAEETFEQMKQSGSLERGFNAIRDGAERYNLNWPRVRNLFSRAYDDFEWTSPISSLRRIFGPFFSDLLDFGVLILKVVAELVAEAFVIGFGSRGRDVWEKIKAIGENIGLIIENPGGFAMNLIRAVGQGIKNFGLNILSHIKKGLLAWVLGPFAAMGVQLPDKLDLKGIINVLLQVLGLTYPQLRPRIVRALNPRGELKVTLVERLIEIINILRTEGLAGIWRKLLDYVENLQMTVINGIRDWVIRAVVEAGIRKLVAWSNPAGALLDILFTIYKLIVFFVEKLEQIISFANSVFESIGRIARGQLNEAARYIENTLSLTIPIMISFLTSLLGLPDIAGAVRRIVTNLRARVHAAVDKVLDFVVKKVKKLIARLIGRFKSSRGEPEGTVNLQGTSHRIAYEQEGRMRRLYIHSEKTEVTAAGVQENLDGMQNCTEPITTQLQPQIEGAKTKLEEQETHEEQESRKPESNASSPDNNARREAAVNEVKTKLEAGTDPNVRATEAVSSGDEDVDQQPPQSTVEDGEQVPEDQKTNVEPDMEDIHFRYVIVPEETNLEASWGPWADMQTKREGFKAKVAEMGLEGRYAVDLDHNPEYQILWRLAHLEYRQDQREGGEDATQEGRMYPQMSALYGNAPLADGNSRPRASADRDFVMAIRYDAHRQLSNTQTPNVSEFNSLCEFSATQQAFVPRRDKDAQVIAKSWPGPIDTAAQTHQSEVEEAYNTMFQDSFVSDETLAEIQRNGPTMIANAGQIVAGEAPSMPDGEEAAGHRGGIGMTRDPVDAELVAGDYGTLSGEIQQRAPSHGRIFDKHHLIEKSILANLKTRFTEARLLPSVADVSVPVAGLTVAGAGLGEVAGTALQAARERSPPLAEADTATEQASLLSAEGVGGVTVFGDGSTEARGYAIAVLRAVNGLLSSQSVANVDTALGQHLQPALNARAQTMRQAVTDGYAGLTVAEDTTPEEAAASLSAKTAEVRARLVQEAGQGFEADLRAALPLTLDQLTANAHGDFLDKYNTSLQQTHPAGAAFPPGSEAAEVYGNLQNRFNYGPGALTVVQEENRARWAA